MAEVRPQSQGTSLAALVAFEVSVMVLTPDIGKKSIKIQKVASLVSRVHQFTNTRQSMSYKSQLVNHAENSRDGNVHVLSLLQSM